MLKPLLVAVQFMTRLPVPKTWLPETYDERLMGQSVLAYPVVGLLIGLILWGTASLLSGLPLLILSALLLSVWVLITGALHLDGLADCADAWVGSHGDRERMLAIMKDSFIGPVGVAVLVSVLLVKFSALASVTNLIFALLVTPVISRAFVILLFLTTPYVREKGLGQQQSQSIPRGQAYTALSLLAIGFIFLLGGSSIIVLSSVIVAFVFLRWFFVRNIGGMTGDTAGAMVEILEAVLLVVFAGVF